MLKRAEYTLACVYEISKLLTTPTRLDAMFKGVLNILASFLDVEHALIAMFSPDGGAEFVVGAHWSAQQAEKAIAELPERVIGEVVVKQSPFIVGDARAAPMFAGAPMRAWAPADNSPFAILGAPILSGETAIGVLFASQSASGAKPADFHEDIRFLSMVASLAGQSARLRKLVSLDRERLLAEQGRLEKGLAAPPISRSAALNGMAKVIGRSDAIQAVIDKARVVAQSGSTVILRGESGTGKEMFASAIHDLSARRGKPFVKLNCAALPESVLESELFGHEKGAFTGAVSQRKGRFELADGGTLFLDEIGEISPTFQAKLLRVLQEGEFERVGGSRTIKVDVRLICATNRDLEDAVGRGEFRADLYYRICVVPILLPPLRARVGDIPLLATEFVKRFNEEHATTLALTQEAVAVLNACYFPGNIRELENCIRRTATLACGREIHADDFACRNDVCLSSLLWKGSGDGARAPLAPPPAPSPEPEPTLDRPHTAPPASPSIGAKPAAAAPIRARRSERERLIDAMETAGWVQAKAGRILGMTPRQVGYALHKHNVDIKRF